MLLTPIETLPETPLGCIDFTAMTEDEVAEVLAPFAGVVEEIILDPFDDFDLDAWLDEALPQ